MTQRFSRKAKSAAVTFIGFTMTNILFYWRHSDWNIRRPRDYGCHTGHIFWFSDAALIVDEADNAFADVYSASVSTQDIFPKINQKMPYRWVHCTQCYTGDGGFYRAMRSVLAFDRSMLFHFLESCSQTITS